jgi:hypothetical protein
MVLAPPPPSKKAAARVALVDIHEAARPMLAECFKQFGIEAVPMNGDIAERMRTEKFEACVLQLGPAAEATMESVRSSRSNSKMVIYGLGGSAQEAMRFSKYGVNAVFQEPLERHAVLKLVRATQMLVLHEFRRYVRIPVVTTVSVSSLKDQFSASSIEISSGGMSLQSTQTVNPGQGVEVSFALLTLPRIWVKGTVTWTKPGEKTFGVRFDARDERRQRVKEWVESYLES